MVHDKCIHIVNINNYFPELWELTFPTIYRYANRINADINIISKRKFPDWHIHYEKMQVYRDGYGHMANFLLDMDILIHPQFPDFTQIVPIHHVGFNDNYHASSKFNIKDNGYFLRDGRDVGIASNAVVSYATTHDIFEPLNIRPYQAKDFTENICLVREGDIDEYCLSHNLAKYGLKYTGITWEDWQRQYFIHLGTGDRKLAIDTAKQILQNWNINNDI